MWYANKTDKQVSVKLPVSNNMHPHPVTKIIPTNLRYSQYKWSQQASDNNNE